MIGACAGVSSRSSKLATLQQGKQRSWRSCSHRHVHEDMVRRCRQASKAVSDIGPGKRIQTAADKGMALVNVLRLMAGQGKVGAVELKDMARYTAAARGCFASVRRRCRTESWRHGRLLNFGSSRRWLFSFAGRKQQRSVAGFVNTLKNTGARQRNSRHTGVDVFDKGGGFRSVRDILKGLPPPP